MGFSSTALQNSWTYISSHLDVCLPEVESGDVHAAVEQGQEQVGAGSHGAKVEALTVDSLQQRESRLDCRANNDREVGGSAKLSLTARGRTSERREH